MKLEVINVIYNGTDYYTMFENEESTLYHENHKFIIYSSKEKLLAYFSSQNVIDNGISYNFDETNINNPIDYTDVLDKWNLLMDISSIKNMHFEGDEKEYTSLYNYLFHCYTSIEPIPMKYRIPNVYINKLRKIFKKAKRELRRFALDKID